MAKTRRIDIQFPLGGLHRAMAYQTQPPYTTPNALNVRPKCALEERARGGQRPALDKAFYSQLGSGNPVQMLGQVSVIKSDGVTEWFDDFSGTALNSVWTTAAWLSASPLVTSNFATITYTAEGGVVRSSLAFKTGTGYTIGLFIMPWAGEHHGKYRIYCRMTTASPNVTVQGVVAELVLTGTAGAYSGSLSWYTGSALQSSWEFTAGSDSAAVPGWFEVSVSGDDVTCY